MDVEAQKLYDSLPHWEPGHPIDPVDFNVVSEGVDLLLGRFEIPGWGLPSKMPFWDPRTTIHFLAEDLNCWIAGLATLRGLLGQELTTWPEKGIPLFEDGRSFDAYHLNQVVECLRQAFRAVFTISSWSVETLGEGWDDDPLSL